MMSNPHKDFLKKYKPEWYEVFDEYSDIDSKGNIFVYKKDEYGYKCWCNEKGQFHRIDGPAFISDFSIEYQIEGNLHNITGPAALTNYTVYFYLDDISYPREKWEVERLKYV